MSDVLDELNAIEKANDLKNKNLISEEMYEHVMDDHKKKEKHLRFIDQVKTILKLKNYETEISTLEPDDFSLYSKLSSKKDLILINYYDKKYTLKRGGNTTLVDSDPDQILQYLKSFDHQKSHFMMYILMIVIAALILFNINIPSSQVSLSDQEIKARDTCMKLIPNVKGYEVSSKKIDKNEIQVKFTNLLTDEYLVGIYILDEHRCVQTRP